MVLECGYWLVVLAAEWVLKRVYDWLWLLALLRFAECCFLAQGLGGC